MEPKIETQKIEGLELFPLKVLRDERGAVMHMIRADQPPFEKFGEVYFSLTLPGVVKGWKRHKIITQNMVVPEGMIRMVVYDDRSDSKTKGAIQTIDFGPENYLLLKMPPMVWYSFSAISSGHAIIANCITDPHAPGESETLPLDSTYIPYSWDKKNV